MLSHDFPNFPFVVKFYICFTIWVAKISIILKKQKKNQYSFQTLCIGLVWSALFVIFVHFTNLFQTNFNFGCLSLLLHEDFSVDFSWGETCDFLNAWFYDNVAYFKLPRCFISRFIKGSRIKFSTFYFFCF